MAPDGFRFSPLGLVVAEHVDKIAFFEPAVTVVDKEVQPDAIRFTLRIIEPLQKPLEEILRGYRIGCFRIAREYRLIRSDDSTPIFDATTVAHQTNQTKQVSPPPSPVLRPLLGRTLQSKAPAMPGPEQEEHMGTGPELTSGTQTTAPLRDSCPDKPITVKKRWNQDLKQQSIWGLSPSICVQICAHKRSTDGVCPHFDSGGPTLSCRDCLANARR